jgi:PAS domain S-box-containing protein
MVSQIFEWVGLLSSSGNLLEVNESALGSVGVQRADVVGQPFLQMPWWIASSDLPQLQATIAQAAAGQSVQCEVRALHAKNPNVTSKVFKLRINPVRADSEPIQFLTFEGSCQSVDRQSIDLGQLEPQASAQTSTSGLSGALGLKELDTSQIKDQQTQEPKKTTGGFPDVDYLQDILNTAIANVGRFRVFANGDREYLYFSAGCERVFGHSAEELMADQSLWMSRVYPEDKETILMPLNKVFFLDCPGPVEYRFCHKDGSLRWISSLYTSICESPAKSWLVTVVSTDITARKQAEADLQQKIERDQLVTEISQYIRQSLELDEVLRRTVERVRQYLQTDRVLIFKFEPDWQGSTVMESVGPDWDSIQMQTIDDPCFRERYIEPYRLGRISTLSDASQPGLEPCYAAFLESLQIKANIVVPILQDDQLWGLLIAHHCTEPRQWLAQEVELLQQLSTHLSIAIQQSELYQQIRQELIERRQTQNALQTSEARFRALSESAPIGIFQTNPDGTCSYTNPHWQELTGLSLEASLGHGWKQAIHPEDRDQVSAEWDSAMSAHRHFACEFRFMTLQGNVRWVSAHAGMMRSATGEVLGFVGTEQDITERKLAEFTLQRLNQELELKVQRRTMELEQLLQQERVFSAITQHIRRSLNLDEILSATVTEVRQVLQADRALIFQLTSDGAGVVIKESTLPGYPSTLGLEFPEECFPQSCYDYYAQGLPRIVMDVSKDEWAACLKDFMQAVGVKTKVVAPIVQTGEDGAPVVWGLLIVHSCAYLRQWQPSEAALMQQLSSQVAIALKQSELHNQLQNSERRFRSAFDNAVNGMAMIALSGRFIRVNLALGKLLGYPSAELLELPLKAIIQPEDLGHFYQKIQDLIADRITSLQIESALKHKSGELRWAISSASLVRDSQGRPLYFVVQVQDMTERRALEQMKSEFISVVSHELRTPLTSIRGSLGLLVSGVLKSQSDTTQRMIEIAAIESERMVRLVNDILDLERLETKKVTLNYQWCSAAEIMQRAIESVQPMAAESNINLALTPTDVQTWADPDRMIQVLVNLISNAVKFSSPGSSVALSARLQDGCRVPHHEPDVTYDEAVSPAIDRSTTQPAQVLFEVVDQGKGIPSDQLEVIFERFHQVNSSDSRDKGGTGLGLAICRNIVNQHGGSIWAESTLGQGSTFYFTLPIP